MLSLRDAIQKTTNFFLFIRNLIRIWSVTDGTKKRHEFRVPGAFARNSAKFIELSKYLKRRNVEEI